jgi:hypothetical protein
MLLVFILHFPPIKPVTVRQQIEQLDPFGTVCFLPAIVSLLLALQWGGTIYAWNSARIIGLFVLSGVLFIAFAVIQVWKADSATLPPRIITERSVSLGILYTLCAGGAMITMIYFIPLWLQAIKGVDALRSSIDTLPLMLSLIVATILSGIITSRTGWYNPSILLCPILMAVGAGLISTFKVSTSSSEWIGYQIIFGLGLGTGIQQASVAAQAVLSKKDVSMGISAIFLAQSLGGAIFVCISQSLFTTHLASGLGEIPGFDPKIILAVGATQLRSVIAPENFAAVLAVYNKALTKAFVVALSVAAFSILPALAIPWKNVKGLKQGGSDEPRSSKLTNDESNPAEQFSKLSQGGND